MRLNMTLNEFRDVCLMLVFGTFYFIPILIPNTGAALVVQTQINQSHSVYRVVLVILWCGVLHTVLQAGLQLRLDLLAARAAIAYSLFAAASLLWAPGPLSALSAGIQGLTSTLFAIYLVSKCPAERLLVMLSWAVMILAVASAIFALALPKYGIDHTANAGAWQGVFSQKNSLALVMVYGIAIAISLNAENLIHRIWKYSLLVFCLAEVALSQSREAWVVTAMLFMLHIALKLFARMAVSSRGLIFMIGSVLALIMGSLIATSWTTFLKLLGRDATLRGRTQLWAAVIEQCKYHPLIGHSVGAFWETPAASRIDAAVGWIPTTAHNGFLEALLELGAVGLVLLLVVFFCAFRSAFTIMLTHPDFESSLLWIRCIFVITVFNMVQNTTGFPASLSWLMLVGGSCVLEATRRAGAIQINPQPAKDHSLMMSRIAPHKAYEST